MSIFEQASRKALRYPSVKGLLTTEALWDLPLSSKSGFDLDSVAKAINANLKALSEESFVATSVNPQRKTVELQLEVVKHVIAVKQTENEAAVGAAERKAQKAKLLALVEQKQDEALGALGVDELKKRIEALG